MIAVAVAAAAGLSSHPFARMSSVTSSSERNTYMVHAVAQNSRSTAAVEPDAAAWPSRVENQSRYFRFGRGKGRRGVFLAPSCFPRFSNFIILFFSLVLDTAVGGARGASSLLDSPNNQQISIIERENDNQNGKNMKKKVPSIPL